MSGPSSCAAIQNCLGWRTEQAGLSQKCRVLYLGRDTKGEYPENSQLEGRSAQKDLKVQVDDKPDHKLARHWCAKGRRQYPGLQDQLN